MLKNLKTQLKIIILSLLIVSPCFAGVAFDGTDDALTAPDNAILRGMSAVTVMAWVKRAGASTVQQRIVSGWNDSTDLKTFQLYNNNSNVLGFEMRCTGTGVNLLPGTGLTNDVWTHVVGVYDGETAYIYKDGVEIGSSTTPSGAIVDQASGMGIGSQPEATENFNGQISDAAIWNADLTVAEVLAIYNSKVKGIQRQIRPANLILYAPLDDRADGTSGDGQIFKDLVSGIQFTGSDGANNTGLTAKAEEILSYP